MSRGRTCLRAGLVSGAWNYCLKSWEGAKISRGQTCPSTFGPDLSQGWTCLGAGLVLGPDLSQGWTCLGAGLVSGPDLSKNFGAGVVQKLQGLKCLAAGIVQKFRARSVSRPDLVRGRTSLGAGPSLTSNDIPSTEGGQSLNINLCNKMGAHLSKASTYVVKWVPISQKHQLMQ
jgi:hypothetical protein